MYIYVHTYINITLNPAWEARQGICSCRSCLRFRRRAGLVRVGTGGGDGAVRWVGQLCSYAVMLGSPTLL